MLGRKVSFSSVLPPPSYSLVLFDEMFLTRRKKFAETQTSLFDIFFSEENEHRPPSLPCHSGQPAAEGR